MKSFNLIILFLAVNCGLCCAQGQVTDIHPTAAIYVVDPQSGQEVLAQDDAAILFKDAFIDLVSNTMQARASGAPGHKTLTVMEMDPSGGNAYQLTLDTKIFGQKVNIYTFSYNVDQNILYYFNKDNQGWDPVMITGNNVTNLNNCFAFGKFNEQAPSGPAVPAAMGQVADNNNDQQDADQPVTTDNAPPVLQADEQPECPVDGYLWQPGYWAFNPSGGYYWVNGTWVAPPQEGLLWTPPYWGFEGGRYFFHSGYWGSEVGYYGGIYYGYGYGGHGYDGGNWHDGHFRYNTAVVRVNVTVVHNVYVDRTVVQAQPHARVSFNGPGGVTAKPTTREIQATSQNHIVDNRQNPKAFTPARPVSNNNNSNTVHGNANRPTGNTPNNTATRTNGGATNAQPGTNNNVTIQRGPNSNFNTPGNNTNNNRPATTPANNAPGANNSTTQRGPNSNFNTPGNNRPATTPANNALGANTTTQRGPNGNYNRPNAAPANGNSPRVPAATGAGPRVPGGMNNTGGQYGNTPRMQGGNRTQGQPQKVKPAPARQAPPQKDDKKQ